MAEHAAMPAAATDTFSFQLSHLATLDPTSPEAVTLIHAMLIQHSLDDLDQQDSQTFVDFIDNVRTNRPETMSTDR